jgi:hypothetical protein
MGNKFNPKIPHRYAHLNPNDVVFTPDGVAKFIVDMFCPSGKILEPCSGEGAFLRALPEGVEWCEIVYGRNFYDYNKPVDWIVTNPPYSDFDRFLIHCMALAENILLLVPIAKIFKSMKTIRLIYNYGGIVKMYFLGANKCGFPFGFPCMAVHFKKGYNGVCEILCDSDSSQEQIPIGLK